MNNFTFVVGFKITHECQAISGDLAVCVGNNARFVIGLAPRYWVCARIAVVQPSRLSCESPFYPVDASFARLVTRVANSHLLQSPGMKIAAVLKQLKQERDRINRQLNALNVVISAFGGALEKTKRTRAGRQMSAAARARIAVAQKARWAEWRTEGKTA